MINQIIVILYVVDCQFQLVRVKNLKETEEPYNFNRAVPELTIWGGGLGGSVFVFLCMVGFH